MFSAVNSRVAVHAMRGSSAFSMLNSRACMEALGFSSLVRIMRGDFLLWLEKEEEVDEVVETDVRVEVVVEVWKEDMEVRRDGEFKASRRGMIMRTCWQTRREERNLEWIVSFVCEEDRMKCRDLPSRRWEVFING